MTVPVVPARHLATDDDDLFFRRPAEEAAAAVVLNDFGSRVLAADAATESIIWFAVVLNDYVLYTRVSKNASNDDGPSSFGGSLLSTLEKRYGWWWCFSLSLSLTGARKEEQQHARASSSTRRRRSKRERQQHLEEEEDTKRVSFVLIWLFASSTPVPKKKKKKRVCVCFVAPFTTKCRRENREEALTKREKREEATTQKKGIKFFCLEEKKKRFLKTYDLGFRVVLKPRKNCMSFSFALT